MFSNKWTPCDAVRCPPNGASCVDHWTAVSRWRGPRGEDVWPATFALMLHFSRWVFIHLWIDGNRVVCYPLVSWSRFFGRLAWFHGFAAAFTLQLPKPVLCINQQSSEQSNVTSTLLLRTFSWVVLTEPEMDRNIELCTFSLFVQNRQGLYESPLPKRMESCWSLGDGPAQYFIQIWPQKPTVKLVFTPTVFQNKQD
jgi:hypothetical protein